MSNIKERILQYAENKGFKKTKFPLEIGMSYSNFKGDAIKTPINSEAIGKIISMFPDIDLYWLITGKAQKQAVNQVSEPKPKYGLEQEIEHLKELLKAKEETIEALKQTTGFKEKPSKAS